MSKESLVHEEVQIIQLPGFEAGGFRLDELCPDINIIHGPNGVGKTSLARSIEWLCWPETAEDHASLVGHLSIDDETWRVEVDNGQVSYQRNGQEANNPSLPPADQRDRYRLFLHGLLQRDNTNESFAEIIERESAGGYDISAAATELGYSDTPSRANKNVVQRAKGAVQEVRDARADVTKLRHKEDELSRLRSELQAARRAQELSALLKQAIDYTKAKNNLAQAESRLAEFPEILDMVDGEEIDRVRSLETDIDEWTTKKDDAEQTKNTAQDQLDVADLPKDGLPTGRVDHLKQLRETLTAAEGRKRNLKETLAAAKQQRDTAKENLPLNVETADLVALDPVTWKTVSKFAREAEEIQSERKTRAAVQRLLDDGTSPGPSLSTLQRASQSLEEWLAVHNTAEAPVDEHAFHIGTVSAVALALTAVALGLLVHPLLLSILVIPAGIFWYALRARTQSTDGGTPRESHRESFEKTGLEPPTGWDREAVRSRLIELYDAIAEHKLANQRAEWRESLATDSDTIQQKEQKLEETRADLHERLGDTPDVSDVEITVMTKRVLDWQRAHEEVVGSRESISTVEKEIETILEEFRDNIKPYSHDTIHTSGDATEAIRDLESREKHRETAKRELTHASDVIQEAAEKIKVLTEQRDGIFTELGLNTTEHARLEELCEQVEEYEATLKDVQEATIRANTEAEELESYPEYEPELKQQELVKLRENLREANQITENFDDLQSRIADIKAEIRQAKSTDRVETALAERGRALDQLKTQLETDSAAMVGNVLIDHVQEATMETGRPDVFDRAREILTTITRGQYRLDFDTNEATFRAYDTTEHKGHALEELSSGTRVQVLLAVRVAFVEQQEQGVQIPLLLDETLANTDDRRAKIIIESMVELARNGRQIFYFTAQGDEVAKWTATLHDTTGVDHEVVDLATVRDADDSVSIPELDSITSFTPAAPSTGGHDHASYGAELNADPVNPYQGVGAVHLWYIVDDIETLRQLLELGIEYWGQLSNLLQWGKGTLSAVDAGQIAVIEQNAAAIREFVDAWKVGRGSPVDREVLEESGAVSSNFIDEVAALAQSVNGDGRRIINALHNGEINRFRSGKANELEAYLQKHEYIETRETLDTGQIRARMIERLTTEGVSQNQAIDRTEELLTRVSET